MEQESNPNIEREASFSTDALPWLAGALEAGGMVTFRIQRYPRRGHAEAYPLISLNETRESFMDALCEQFGGHKRQEGNAFRWTLFGYKAAELVIAMEPYTSSRKEMVMAVKNWLDSTTEERVQIAEEMKVHDRHQDGSLDEYGKLLDNPRFTAGILDNRANVYPSHESRRPVVAISSKNHNLLLALQQRYSGVIGIHSKAGTKMSVGEKTGVTKRDANLLTIAGTKARELVEYTLPYLRIPPYEEWDRKIVDEIKETRTQQTDSLILFIRDELERFQEGELQRLSTKEEIAEKFEISPRLVKRRLASLDEASRRSRHKLLLTQNAIDHNEKYGNPAKKKISG